MVSMIVLVRIAVPAQHPALLVFGQEVVEDEHDREGGQDDEPGPEDGHADAPEAQGQVLGVADITIEPFIGDAPLKDFAQIDLEGADGEGGQAQEEQDRPGHPHALQKQGGGQDHVGQEEQGGPAGGGVGPQEIEDRAEHRIEEKGKGTDHDHDFEGHDKEEEDTAGGGDLLGQGVFTDMAPSS